MQLVSLSKFLQWLRIKVLTALVPLVTGLVCAANVASGVTLPDQGPGGPILIITSGSANYGNYYAEILRNEGLNAFAVADIGSVTPTTLAAYDLVVLAKMSLSSTQAAMFSDWVSGGGNLIAISPPSQLAVVLGLTPVGTTLSNGYILIDASTKAGHGIVNQTIQFHGSADRYTLNGASTIATLYSTAASVTANPAVTMNTFGAGQAAAFTYDLASSIVYTRQGNPAWAAQERDGFSPIRSDDQFYGNAASDPQADWIDLTKVAIPQADEQQRLLANLILTMNLGKKPLPRFWYFPNGKKAVVIMTGDDHGNGGTIGRFNQFLASSNPGCSIANWECVRATSYVYPSPNMSDAQVAAFTAQGFEIGLHINTACADFTVASLEAAYADQIGSFVNAYPSAPSLRTQRHHCVVWSDWITGARTESNHGMRLDASYYFWPPSWVNNVPGLFTGSAMPMRFADLDGTLLDVYEATTQMTDESNQSYPFTIDTLLDRAIGAQEYYGVYTVNAHDDLADSPVADAVVASAKSRGLPIVSSAQMLQWLDGRNSSSFGSIAWNGSSLSFTVVQGAGADGLQAMLPSQSQAGILSTITLNGGSVAFAPATIKGIAYATFAAPAGAYVATYVADPSLPTVTATSPGNGATAVGLQGTVRATFSEAMDPTTIGSSTFELRDAANVLVAATVTWDGATFTATLTPSGWLVPNTTYTATVKGGVADPRAKDLAGNALANSFTWSFTTEAGPCPCSAWSSASAPGNPSAFDSGSVELGVKFRLDTGGLITGIRFYKGAGNTGTHQGTLWTNTGQLLASAAFTNETTTGWQQVNFTSPVPVAANTVYVASYFAPNNHYAYDANYFASNGVDNPPVHLLADGVSGGNGVYRYSASSAYPSSTYQASNYWVDVVFAFGSGGPDTTSPTVVSTFPANGATGVGTTSGIAATFSEAIDPATIVPTTFTLRDPSNNLVPAAITYNAATLSATLTPNNPLAGSTIYSATVVGGATDPRVKDLAGNALLASTAWSFTTASAGGNCASPPNPIVAENCLTGNAASEWDVSGAGDPGIQGFATDISVNRGSPITFKVKTDAPNYRFDIYRMGYYNGAGARKVATIQPSASLPQAQPACLTNAATKLLDCGNWSVSAQWAVPVNATSGIYFAKLVRADTGGSSHVFFIVRDDSSHSDVLFQTSDLTWQAYNNYSDTSGDGPSLYGCCGSQFDQINRAYKVSYNRPFRTRAMEGGVSWVFNAEYPMVRWLEANGYDTTYFTGVDAARLGSLIPNHRIYMPVGHDEYWSGPQRVNVEAARGAGTNLAFFTGNGVFWKTRWESSIDGANTPFRTLVGYKETHANAVIDPNDPPTATGTWRDPRFGPGGTLSPTADGGRPENGLMGTLFMVNGPRVPPDSIQIPAADGKMRFWRNTSIAGLTTGQTATLPAGTLGFEWDVDADNGFRPAGLVRLSTTVVNMTGDYLQDFGSTFGSGTANHALTLYRHSSGALVFGAGTIQWSWGLDSNHDHPNYAAPAADTRMQQATVNLLADMNVQPATLRSGLLVASPSADATAPSSAITSPATGASVPPNSVVTISGTATDSGGVVGGVEISVDGGATWHPANGRASWTYNWTTPGNGTFTIKSRAVDDSGNLETAGSGISVTVTGADTTAPTVTATSPVSGATAVSAATAVTATFSEAMNAATITTTTFRLRNPSNTVVAATVTYDAATLTATLTPSSPLANATTYTATVLGGTTDPRVKDLAGNALAATRTWSFTTADTVPPTVTATSPVNGATGVSGTANVTATFSEAMDPATITAGTFVLRDPANALVAATVSYNATSRVATLNPTPTLAAGTAYTATVLGGTGGAKDLAGNPLATDRVWTFTIFADVTPPIVTATSPASGATSISRTANVTATFSEAMNPATINANTFVLRDPSNVVVSATVSLSSNGLTATLDPASSLAFGASYTATVVGGSAGAKDVAGNALAADKVWSFTTVVDTTPPTITTMSPAAGATAVARSTNVTVTFSEDMDATTINTTTFMLRNPSNIAIPGNRDLQRVKPQGNLNP
jgi:hypothetical protein